MAHLLRQNIIVWYVCDVCHVCDLCVGDCLCDSVTVCDVGGGGGEGVVCVCVRKATQACCHEISYLFINNLK